MAAGLGFKDFVTGEVLTAADVDGYLMQGVWVFASAAARDAAVTSPQEGNFAYLKDTNVTTYYTGSAWANLDTTGMTNPMTTTGDTIYSSSGSTPARLGIGSTGQVLTVAGGVPSWATPAGGATFVGVSLYVTSSTTISNNTFTTLTFASEEFDTDGFHDNSTNTDRITIPSGKAGKYLITAKIDIDPATASSRRDLYIIQKNSGGGAVADKWMRTASVTGTNIACLQSTVFNASVGDYFYLDVYQNSGGNMTLETKMFQATYLGA